MLDGFFRTQIAFLETYFGTKINSILYRLLWDYFKAYDEKYFQKICSKIIETFRPTSQNPFPLIVHFIDAMTELKNSETNYLIPEYKLLPEPDGGRMSEKEIDEFISEVMGKIIKNISMPVGTKA